MSRPPVAVVMPFAGDPAAAVLAAQALRAVDVSAADELVLVDNSDEGVPIPAAEPAITVVLAAAEHSAAHARNQGAAHSGGDWILFLDSDCEPRAGLLDAYFADPVAEDVGALVGEIVPAPATRGIASRYAETRSFLSQEAHLAHPYRPRAAAANLLVRRRAYDEVGGFFEGVRAAEDTDFSWRLQAAGWRLELRGEAWVSHRYRTTLRELLRQWRGYAAGRAWLARRYEGFVPQPALGRAVRGGRRSAGTTAAGTTAAGTTASGPPAAGASARRSPFDRAAFLALDGILAVEELVGFAISNRPATDRPARPVDVVLLAERFPMPEDPLVELALQVDGARVQAVRRPDRLELERSRSVDIDYMEDDGLAARTVAVISLVTRHPIRVAIDAILRKPHDPPLRVLAPAVRRVQRERSARILALGPRGPRAIGGRIVRLAGRELDDHPRAHRFAGVRRLRARR